jgi:hypothetical protein
MRRIEWAGSGSSFGETEDEVSDSESFKYVTIGLPADQVREGFKIPFPEYIKLDVDGIEALILAGAKEILTKAKSVLVEVQHSEAEREVIYSCLIKSGLSKKQVVRHNEIWTRN